MAIVKMNKFMLLTLKDYKQPVLKELQKFADVHFKSLGPDEIAEAGVLKRDLSPETVNHLDTELSKVKFTLKKIDPYAVRPKGIKAFTAPPKTMSFDEFDNFINSYDYDTVYQQIKENDETIEQVKSETTKLRSENEALKAWQKLDISPEELEHFHQVKALIGSVNKLAADSFKLNAEAAYPQVYIELIGEIKDDATMLLLIPEAEYDEALEHFKNTGFSKLSLNFKGIPEKLIHENNQEIERLKQSEDKARKIIESLGGEYENLKIAVDYFETLLERERACENFLKTENVVYMEGWVPEESTESLKQIIASVCGGEYYMEEEAVEKDSQEVPIKLKNNKVVRAFEDVTSLFSMPQYNEIDPTAVFMPFYVTFFGFMVGDTGYGLLLLLGTWFAKKKLYLSKGMKTFMDFFFFLSFGVIIAGFLYGSFFGFSFFRIATNASTGEAKAILDTNVDVLVMLVMSIVLGFVQILTGLIIRGYLLLREGKLLAALFDAGFWIIALTSGICWILAMAGVLPAGFTTAVKTAFFLSLLGLVATQGRSAQTPVGKAASGLYEVYGLSGYVGDLVSYTRISALALSGAYIAYSFNLMAGLLTTSVLGWILAVIVFLVGASLNIGLSLLGAYVHTCRLQYVEYFGKFYTGGGIPFTAFSLKNKFVNIKNQEDL